MFDFLKSLFNPAPPSSTTAKERLRLVLLSDHLSLSPETVKALKADLLEVISRYVEIDPSHADVTFEHRENEVAMLANIPITGVRERKRALAENVAAASPAQATAVPVESATVAASESASSQTTLDLTSEPADAPQPDAVAPVGASAATAETPAPTPVEAAAPQALTHAQRRRRRKKAQNAAPRPAGTSHLGKPAQA